MGACCDSTIEQQATKEINANIGHRTSANVDKHHILLLGPGASGKTTILKQMRKIHHGNIPEDAIDAFTNYIRENVVLYMQILCVQSKKFELALSNTENEARRESMIAIQTPMKVNADIYQMIKCLWTETAIQNTLRVRHKYQIHDNVRYFMEERIDHIVKPEYVPSFNDYLRIRMRTTGWIMEEFQSEFGGSQHSFVFIDVGGQKAERKKWMNMLTDEIKAVVYVIAISEYDMTCFENNSVLRLQDGLTLFEEVIEKGFMEDKTCVLFFNKWDLFEAKLRNPDSQTIDQFYGDFPDDYDPRSPVDVSDYIEARFSHIYQKKYPTQSSLLHRHNTCSLDTKQIHTLITSMQSDMVSKQLFSAGY